MTYTTYLFDFDYTLADSSRGIVTCFRNVLNKHEYTGISDDDIKRTIGKTLQDSFSILTGVTDADQLEIFRKEYVKEADTHMTVNTILFLETKSVLLALKDAGARIGIISTKYRYRIQELIDQQFPGDFFDIIVGGEDVKEAKPSPEGVLLAIKKLGVHKSETIYIGDSIVDGETAQAAKVDFAGVLHGITTAEELSKYPHQRIMKTLDELLENWEKPSSNSLIQNPPHQNVLSPQNVSDEKRFSAPHKKKMINVWQIILLLFLLWLAYEELGVTSSYFFPTVFIFTLWGISQTRRFLPDKVKTFTDTWWLPCKIRLRALHIKLINGRKTPLISNEYHTCQNCGTTYIGNYCNRCGQSNNTPRYRLSNALKNIVGGFTNIDNGFGRTLTDLLHRPGYMIRDFIGGKRIHYFRPFQTLFVLAALYIMCVQLVDPEALEKKDKPNRNDQEEIMAAREEIKTHLAKTDGQTEKKILEQTLKGLDKGLENAQKKDTLATTTKSKVNASDDDELLDNLLRDGSKMTDKLESYIQHSPFLMKVWNLMKGWAHGNKAFLIIATLPLFALTTQLAFRSRKNKMKYNTTEHVFIQAYIACQMLLLSIIVLPFNGKASMGDLYELPIWVIFILFCWDYKQLYSFTWWKSFWRTILMLFYSLILLILLAIIVALLAALAIYISKPLLG